MNGPQGWLKLESAQNVNLPIGTEKKCTKCGMIKLLANFSSRKDRMGQLKSYCRKCEAKIKKEWLKQNPTKDKEMKRKRRLKKYGLTPNNYEQLLNKQNGGCAICGQKSAIGNNLSVDHNHKTGVVRALLCKRCNSVLGYVQEDRKLLAKFIKYLKNTNS